MVGVEADCRLRGYLITSRPELGLLALKLLCACRHGCAGLFNCALTGFDLLLLQQRSESNSGVVR